MRATILHEIVSSRLFGHKAAVPGRYLFDDLRLDESDVGALELQVVNFADVETLTIDMLRQALQTRVDEVDFEQAKADVKPFLSNVDGLEIGSADCCHQLLNPGVA